HCQVAVQAMAKGKHVLCEKLMAHTVTECKEMSRFATENDMLLATGHQRHYSFLYDNAVHAIKTGQIGHVHHIRAQWHRNNLPGSDSWQPPLPEEVAKQLEKKQADLAKEMANAKMNVKRRDDLARQVAELKRRQMDHSVKASEFGYADFPLNDAMGQTSRNVSALEELVRWRLWKRTGGGLMAELGSHQLDAASIFLSALRSDGRRMNPLSVVANGVRNVFPLDRDVDDHVYAMFEFPGEGYFEEDGKTIADPNKKVVVSYSSINGNGFGGYGEVVMGTKGTLSVLGEKTMEISRPGQKAPTSVGMSAGAAGAAAVDSYETGGVDVVAVQKEGGPDSRGYTEEIEHLAWCIRNRDPANVPRCNPEVALADACMALVANEAMWGPGRVEFDENWFDINSDATPEGEVPNPKRHLA
ncbi:MAG: Gfo/Idh/MocA family oxidoreductase, partial [Pirellulales bacterium]|nr:Gfo/Idh/MocA family oxidoreductase [Pirellulales bacterium]